MSRHGSPASAWLLLASLALQPAGCRWIAGHAPAQSSARADARPPRPDEAGPADGRATEASGAVDLHADATPRDVGIDAGAPCTPGAGNATQPLAANLIACTCPSSATDCDGLPTARDPQPSLCNRLLLEETFQIDPLVTKRWTPLAGDWTWSCGWLSQNDSQNADKVPPNWARAGDVLGTTRYLVEARLRLDTLGWSEYWSVALTARQSVAQDAKGSPQQFIMCTMRVDSKIDKVENTGAYVVNPDLKAESKNTPGDYRGGWPLDNPVGLYDEKENNIYILQLWFDSTPKAERLRCRLFDGQGKKLLRQTSYWMSGKDAKHIANLPKLPGRIGLRTWNRAASIDYIRVFELQ